MSDSQLNEAERRWQPSFIKLLISGAFLLLLARDARSESPDRRPLPERVAELRTEPLDVPRDPDGNISVTGAWRLISDDERVMGLSALAVLPDGRLQALSDSGVLVTFARPGGSARALVSDLPNGPGYPTFKKFRDSEAMVVDPDGGGRLIAFENQHSLWRYDGGGRAAAMPVALTTARWKRNAGIEAMVADPDGGALLLLHEGGRQVLRVTPSRAIRELPLEGATGGIADAVRLPNGRVVVSVREIGLLGLTNRLAWLERAGAGYRLRTFATLPLGPLDNVEGMAVERTSNGKTLLWAVTDNDGWRRTVLLRLELDTTKAPAGAGA